MEAIVKTSYIEKGIVPSNLEVAEFILKQIDNRLTENLILLVYKHKEIQIGIIQDKQINIENKHELQPEFLKELRVFSENGELYVWKQQQHLKYRLRIDNVNEGTPVNVYIETHFMWGNKLKSGNTVHELNRGMELKLPFSLSQAQLPLKYNVYNYYNYDENGIIQFYDARLVSFLDKEGKPLA